MDDKNEMTEANENGKHSHGRAFRFPKWEREMAFRREVPPTIVRSLLKIIKYLEPDEERDYHDTPVNYRKGHVYRDMRRVLAWVTRWADSTFDFPEVLPTLGQVVVSLGESRLVDRADARRIGNIEDLDRILDAHAMHRWGEGPDVAAGEGNLDESCRVAGWAGSAETVHFVKNGEDAIKVTVSTSLQAMTYVTAENSKWPDSGGKHDYFYDDTDSPPRNWPWNPRSTDTEP